MGWFGIIYIQMFKIYEVTLGTDEYIDKSSVRVSHSFNNTLLSRYSCPRNFVFDKISEFKQYFTPMLKDFDIKPVLTTIKPTIQRSGGVRLTSNI